MSDLDTLKAEILRTSQELAIKKALLAALNKKKVVPFAATRFGKFYYRAIERMTAPFVSMNQNAFHAQEHPYEKFIRSLSKKANSLLKRAKGMERYQNADDATKLACDMAELVMEMEDFVEQTQTADFNTHITYLRAEVERLRPPRKEHQKIQEQELEEAILAVSNSLGE